MKLALLGNKLLELRAYGCCHFRLGFSKHEKLKLNKPVGSLDVEPMEIILSLDVSGCHSLWKVSLLIGH